MYKGYMCVSSVYIKESGFKEFRFVAKLAIESLGYLAVRNPEDVGITQKSYEAILNEETPIFILIIGNQKSDMIKRECAIALKKGLHIIAFLKVDNSKRISQSTTQFMKSLSEDIFLVDCSCFETCEELHDSIIQRIKHYESRKKYIDIYSQKDNAYLKGKDMLSETKNLFILCQSSSTLILGPRKGNAYEREFYVQLIEFINNASRNEKSIIHLFSYNDTRKAILSGDYDISNSFATFSKIYSSNDVTEKELTIRYVDKEIFPFILADNSLFIHSLVCNEYYSFFIPGGLITNVDFDSFKYKVQQMGKYLRNEKVMELSKTIIG